MARDKTVIVTTHNMDEADRIADRVAIIDSGRLLQLDTPRNLKRSIGKGDMLELVLKTSNPSHIDKAVKNLEEKGFTILRDDYRCSVKAMDLVPKIHGIYQVLEGAGVAVSEMKIRENSLEDVFIHLTGKSLRQ
jgi:ABC-2 type transport system ATP-binding protein